MYTKNNIKWIELSSDRINVSNVNALQWPHITNSRESGDTSPKKMRARERKQGRNRLWAKMRTGTHSSVTIVAAVCCYFAHTPTHNKKAHMNRIHWVHLVLVFVLFILIIKSQPNIFMYWQALKCRHSALTIAKYTQKEYSLIDTTKPTNCSYKVIINGIIKCV